MPTTRDDYLNATLKPVPRETVTIRGKWKERASILIAKFRKMDEDAIQLDMNLTKNESSRLYNALKDVAKLSNPKINVATKNGLIYLVKD